MIAPPIPLFFMSETAFTVLSEILTQERAERATDLPESEFWEFFSAHELLRGSHQLSPDEIRSGLVGNTPANKDGSDGGLDSVFLLVNGILIRDEEQARSISRKGALIDFVIIQSKMATSFTLEALNRIGATCETIFRLDKEFDSFAERYNARLLNAIRCFRAAFKAVVTKNPTLNVVLCYAARADTGVIPDSMRGRSKEICERVAELLLKSDVCRFEFVGAREMIQLHNRPRTYSTNLDFRNMMSDDRGGWAGLVEMRNFHAFITEGPETLRDHLFESNVRDYEGNVEVNKQIRETLASTDDKAAFWWLNNGITMVAQSVGPETQTRLAIEDPQIINGLQTAQSIFHHFRDTNQESLSDGRLIMVRIIGTADDKIQDRIIRSTNNQTRIPKQYLRGSDEIQRDIEVVFNSFGMHYDRKKNSWRKSDKPLSKVVGMLELAQSVAAVILGEADHSRARPSRYFSDEMQYGRVFSKKTPIESYVVCAQLKKRVEAYLRENLSDDDARTDLLFYVLMAVGHPASSKKKSTFSEFDVSLVQDTELESALKLVSEVYSANGANDKAAKGTGMVRDLLVRLGLPPRKEPLSRKARAALNASLAATD